MLAPRQSGVVELNVDSERDASLWVIQHANDNMIDLVYELRGSLFGTVISTALFGILTLCTCITTLLISHNLKLQKTRWAAWYIFATVTMFISTSIYWAFILYDTFTIAGITTSAVDSLNSAEQFVAECLGSSSGAPCSLSHSPNDVSDVQLLIFKLIHHNIPLEYCVGTVALTTNIVIGDIIVLGRVFVLWPRSRLVRLMLIFLLLGTIVTGIVSTAHSCREVDRAENFLDPSAETGLASLAGPAAGTLVGSFFEGDPFGIAASVFSLATNAISTCIIGYRAWEHRVSVRAHSLRSLLGRSQVSRALALLIESGVFYSAIWIFVVAYQFMDCPTGKSGDVLVGNPHSFAFRAFTTGWKAFTEGGLVIVIAIYPTVIMLLAALNRSECDAIASHRGDGQSDTGVLSAVFRGSRHHAQLCEVRVPGDSRSALHPPSSPSSSADLESVTADTSCARKASAFTL